MADAPTTDAPAEGTTDTTTVQVTETAELGDGGKAALDAERKARREAEKQAKAATAELQKLQEANMNEVDRALSAAKAEGVAEGTRSASVRLVDAEVRAAAAGRNVDTDALLEGLDRTKFLGEDGEPDLDAITAWMDRIAPKPEEQQAPGFPSLEQGTRAQPEAMGLGSDALTQALKNKLGIR